MSFDSWLQNLRNVLAPRRGHRNRARRGSLRSATHRLHLEPLEDRRLLALITPVDYTVGSSPQAIVAADFNNDGRLDLVTANAGSNSVSVLLGSANGTLGPAIDSPAGYSPKSIAVGDFDGDGKLDLAAVNALGYRYSGRDGVVSVMFGNGNGSFQPPIEIALEPFSTPRSVAVGDFNGDGTMDLSVASDVYYSFYYDDAQASVLLSNGDRTFAAPESVLMYYGGTGVTSPMVVTDFNGDDHQDVLVGFNYELVRVLLGDGEGNLASASDTNWYIRQDRGMAVGDLNGDDVADLVAADYANVNVRLGNGAGGFEPPPGGQSYAAGDGLSSVALGDFDHDGALDVAVANFVSNNVSILRGVGDGTFSEPENFAAGPGTYAVAAGDFNSDGWLDVATANVGGDSASVLINDQSWPTPPPRLVSISDATVTEGNTGAASIIFTLTLSKPAAVDVTVHYATADITAAAGSDYRAASGSVVIPAGQTRATFTVAISGDRLPEPTETFFVNLSAATNATIGDGQGVGTILDNEPRVSITDVTKSEGKKGKKTQFTFTVELSAAYDQPVTMSFQTVNGNATTGDGDYVAKSGTLTFAPGETVKTITIAVKGDSKRELNEVFYLDLFGLSSHALFTKNRGLGTILNDD